MKLKIIGFENEIDFFDEINVLVVENQKLFTNIIEMINNKINGLVSNEIILYNDDFEEINMGKEMYLLLDLFNIDYNSKKFINKIYDIVSKNIANEQDTKFNNIILELRNYLINEINEIPFEFTMDDEISIEQVLKLFDVKIDKYLYGTVLERLEFIIDMLSTLDIAHILIVANLNQFLTNDEILELYKYSMYNNVKLLILERYLDREKISQEKVYKIDSGFDEFIT